MALRLKKDIKKASYYVWFLGAQESRGLRGDEYALPAIRQLEQRAKDLEPFKVTLQVSHKGLKIIQNVSSKGKQQTIKHFIPHSSITSALVQGDVVACVLLLYNPVTGCPVHVHAYRCDSDHTADMLYAHLMALIERPENQKKFAEIERKLQIRDALEKMKKPPDSSLGSEVSRESDSGSQEDKCVATLYDSLAAELKQKLSTGKSPILLPPRDYDTVHRQKGNLNNIDTRRCLNQNIVGVNARRKLESSGGSSGIGSDLAPSPERNEYTRQADNHSTSEEDWAESTAYLMHEAFEASPRRSSTRNISPRGNSPPRRALSPTRRATSPRRSSSSPRRVSSPRHGSPRRASPRRVSPARLVSQPARETRGAVSPIRRNQSPRRASPARRPTSPRRYDRGQSYHEDFDREFRDQLAPFREAALERRYRHESLDAINKAEKPNKFVEEPPIYRRKYAAETKPSQRSIERDPERRFGKLQRGGSESSLFTEISPKDRFNVAKEKFMNLERERFNRELEQHMAIRRSMLERNSSSTSSPEEERREERPERRDKRQERREEWQERRETRREPEIRRPQRSSREERQINSSRDIDRREIERLPRVGRKRDDLKRYEYGNEEFVNKVEPKRRDEFERYPRERRDLDRRFEEEEVIEPVVEERKNWNGMDRQRAFSRSRLLDETRQSFVDDDTFFYRNNRNFRDLDRQQNKFRHSYAEPIPRGRLGAVRPY